MDSRRIKEIDAAKGLAILLVVLGHSIQANITDVNNDLVFLIIYSFHMPLFMFISGFLALNRVENAGIQFLKRKFLYLVVPFCSWYLISFIINSFIINGDFKSILEIEPLIYSLKTSLLQLWISPDLGLWFLWILFLNFCYLIIIIKFERIFQIYSFIIFIILLKICPFEVMGLTLMKWHFVFFSAGYLTARYKSKILNWKNELTFIALLFPILSLSWKRTEKPLFDPYLSLICNNSSILQNIVISGYKYLVPFSGIIFSFMIIEKIRSNQDIFNILSWFGTVTIDIYVSHQMFLIFGVGEGMIKIISSFLIALILSLSLSFFILRKNTILSKVFLGKWS